MRLLSSSILLSSLVSAFKPLSSRSSFTTNHINHITSRSLTMQSSAILNLSVIEYESILKSDLKDNYQIIDVREPNELELVNIKTDAPVINLPLSTSDQWTQSITDGDILDKTKPTICVCHHGMRSQRVAMFLTQQAGFEEVYNLTGGVNEYANKVDSSIGFY